MEHFDVLSENQKWKNPNNYMFEQQNKARRTSFSDSSPGSGSNSKDNSPMIGNVNERPVGRHKAQQMEQRSAEFNRFMEAQEKWSSDSSGRAESVRQSRLEAALRMEAAMKEQEDRKDARFREKKRLMLLSLDFSKLTPLQREMAEEDLKKYRSEGSSSSGF